MTKNEHEIAETLYQFHSTIDHMKYVRGQLDEIFRLPMDKQLSALRELFFNHYDFGRGMLEKMEEAIEMANNTPYSLAGAVFTADGSRALRVIKEIRAGITWINCYNPCFNEAPWGDYKMSGIGRELGVHGLVQKIF